MKKQPADKRDDDGVAEKSTTTAPPESRPSSPQWNGNLKLKGEHEKAVAPLRFNGGRRHEGGFRPDRMSMKTGKPRRVASLGREAEKEGEMEICWPPTKVEEAEVRP